MNHSRRIEMRPGGPSVLLEKPGMEEYVWFLHFLRLMPRAPLYALVSAPNGSCPKRGVRPDSAEANPLGEIADAVASGYCRPTVLGQISEAALDYKGCRS
jgi:hypothetical protein